MSAVRITQCISPSLARASLSMPPPQPTSSTLKPCSWVISGRCSLWCSFASECLMNSTLQGFIACRGPIVYDNSYPLHRGVLQ